MRGAEQGKREISVDGCCASLECHNATVSTGRESRVAEAVSAFKSCADGQPRELIARGFRRVPPRGFLSTRASSLDFQHSTGGP